MITILSGEEIIRWRNRSGKEVPVSELDDQHLINILRMYQRQAEIKRILFNHIDPKYNEGKEWFDFITDDFKALEYEAARRRLDWDLFKNGPIILPEDCLESIDLKARGRLEREIVGALRDSINAHGVITKETSPSAAKRVIGVIKAHNRKVKKSGS